MDGSSDLEETKVYYRSSDYFSMRIAFEESLSQRETIIKELADLVRAYGARVPAMELMEMPGLVREVSQMVIVQQWDLALSYNSALIYLLEGVVAQLKHEVKIKVK